MTYTEVRQNNGIQILYTFLYLYGVGRPFAFSTAAVFMVWTRTSFEYRLAEFYTILLEEYLEIALVILEVGICSPLESPKLTRVVQ
jgi:hypothetical protein